MDATSARTLLAPLALGLSVALCWFVALVVWKVTFDKDADPTWDVAGAIGAGFVLAAVELIAWRVLGALLL